MPSGWFCFIFRASAHVHLPHSPQRADMHDVLLKRKFFKLFILSPEHTFMPHAKCIMDARIGRPAGNEVGFLLPIHQPSGEGVHDYTCCGRWILHLTTCVMAISFDIFLLLWCQHFDFSLDVFSTYGRRLPTWSRQSLERVTSSSEDCCWLARKVLDLYTPTARVMHAKREGKKTFSIHRFSSWAPPLSFYFFPDGRFWIRITPLCRYKKGTQFLPTDQTPVEIPILLNYTLKDEQFTQSKFYLL